MSSLIIQQGHEFFVMFCGGTIIGALHQVLEIYQKRAKPTAVIGLLQDMLFWLLASLLAASFLYYCSYGKLSFHAFLGCLLGILLWVTVLSQIFHPLLRWFYDIIKH